MSDNLPAIQQSYFPTESDWKMLTDVGTRAFASGLLPSSIKNAQAAAIIALKAKELGIPIMVGFAHIFIVNGKPSMSAELIQATARKFLPGLSIIIKRTDNTACVIDVKRPEQGSVTVTFSFTIEDAKQAGLMSNDPWKKYPADMLFSRCITRALRKICPEALMGISYTPEEMGANVNEHGEVIETTGKTIPPHQHVEESQVSGEATKAKVDQGATSPPWVMNETSMAFLAEKCKMAGLGQKTFCAWVTSNLNREFKEIADLKTLTDGEYGMVIKGLNALINTRTVGE